MNVPRIRINAMGLSSISRTINRNARGMFIINLIVLMMMLLHLNLSVPSRTTTTGDATNVKKQWESSGGAKLQNHNEDADKGFQPVKEENDEEETLEQAAVDYEEYKRNSAKKTSRKSASPAVKDVKGKTGKSILFWNPLKKRDYPYELQCGAQRCMMRNDIQNYDDADAVIVSYPFNIKLPSKRRPEQLWVFYNSESPSRLPINLMPFNNVFNLTITYRLDSDIPNPYGVLMKMPRSWIKVAKARKAVNNAEGKTKMVAWMVSHCNDKVKSGRMRYARELQKHLPVDIFGACGNMSCPRTTKSECFDKLKKEYKFYLSFENALCKDYATEKLWTYMQYNLVPVVLGGYNYSSLPPKTVINVQDFASVKALADYLKELDKDEKKYNEYFEWKKEYRVKGQGELCGLCKFLHKNPNFRRTYKRIDQWWSESINCVKPKQYYKSYTDFSVR